MRDGQCGLAQDIRSHSLTPAHVRAATLAVGWLRAMMRAMALDRRDDCLTVHRFDEKIISTCDSPGLLVDLPGDDDDRYVHERALTPHSFDKHPSVETGHVK